MHHPLPPFLVDTLDTYMGGFDILDSRLFFPHRPLFTRRRRDLVKSRVLRTVGKYMDGYY